MKPKSFTDIGAFLFFNGHAGIIPHVLTRSGQFIKKGGFAGIRVSGQCYCGCHLLFNLHFDIVGFIVAQRQSGAADS